MVPGVLVVVVVVPVDEALTVTTVAKPLAARSKKTVERINDFIKKVLKNERKEILNFVLFLFVFQLLTVCVEQCLVLFFSAF